MPGVRSIGGIVMKPEAVAKQCLAATLRGQQEIVPGVLPRVFVGLTDRRLLPRRLSRAIAAFAFDVS